MAKTTLPQTQTGTPQTIADVGAQWSAAQRGSAVFLWRFARALLRFTIANPKVTGAEIGTACATAAGREKPYSKGWVSRALSAARAVDTEPASASDATRFSDLFHGHAAPNAKGKTKGESSADDALRGAIAFARLAIKRGMPVDQVETAITAALESGESDDAESEAA